FLDGNNTGQVTNAQLNGLAPGVHSVALSLTGYQNFNTQVTVTAGQTVPIYAALVPVAPPVPTTGNISVSSTPSGAAIFLDGAATGQVTNSVLPNITPGSHSVILNLTGYQNVTAQVNVIAGQTAQVYASFVPVPPPVPTTGNVSVNSYPTGALIYLDGSNTGQSTNSVLYNVAAGSHTILLNLTGYQNATAQVVVLAGQTAQVYVTLLPAIPPSPTKGSISVSSSPTGALVYLDSVNTGQTTNTLLANIAPGSHSLVLNLTGYKNSTVQVLVIAGQTAQVFATLTPVKPPVPTTGSINVNSNPTGAEIFLDGMDTGVQTVSVLSEIQPGSHSVLLNLTGYKNGTAQVTVVKGQTAQVYISLTPLPPPEPTNGSISVNSDPTGAEIFLDGMDTGKDTNVVLDEIQPGVHSVLLNLTGYYNSTVPVTVVKGQTAQVFVSLVPIPPAPPVANFTADPTSGQAPLMVQFTDESTGIVTGWAWDFNNDGHIDSTAQDPMYTYHLPGTYSVNLTVTGPGGSNSKVSSEFISVSPSQPIADFNANPTSGAAPLTVQFTDESVGEVTGWAWDFNNDGHIDSTAQNPTYTYLSQGTYSVNLTVTGPGGSDSKVKDEFISVSPAHPIADFNANPTSGAAPLTVHFTDESIGNVTAWAWDFNNDGHIDSTAQNPTYTYLSQGTYSVNLTVTGPGGSDSKVKDEFISVSPTHPVADFQANVTAGYAPLAVQFIDQSTGNVTAWAWDFNNDGQIDSTAQNPVYTYQNAGTYSVNLTVSGPGGSSSKLRTNYIQVNVTPEGAFIGNPTSGMVPLRVQFTEISTGNPWLRYWNFGDASTIVTGKDPSHVYIRPGDFTVTLTTIGPNGTNVYTREKYIHVAPNPNYTPPLQLFVPIPWSF
ncbi:MAG TPA: PEGA domain-containing protein, partial [Methanoregulaceae archaeon]|nr:PEGA domain-containing protein [Methanoregulaceae archaeon]